MSNFNSLIDKITKFTEHKVIYNLIAIWKKIKPSKTYWTVAIPTVAFILSQAKSWKIADIIASYSEKQIKNSDYPLTWQIINAIATEFYDTASWELVWLGVGLLIILTYAFIKEGDSKQQKETLKLEFDLKMAKDEIIILKNQIIKEEMRQEEKYFIEKRVERLEIILTHYHEKGWIVEDANKYIVQKENKNE